MLTDDANVQSGESAGTISWFGKQLMDLEAEAFALKTAGRSAVTIELRVICRNMPLTTCKTRHHGTDTTQLLKMVQTARLNRCLGLKA